MSARVSLTGLDREDAETNLAIFEAVVADLRDLLANGAPTAEMLDGLGAPVLEAWALAARPVPCLVGAVIGHPTVRGPLVTTSPVLAIVRVARVARTQSRWYRLGEPLGANVSGGVH